MQETTTQKTSSHTTRIHSRRSRQVLDFLAEHAWLLSASNWLVISSGSGEPLRLAEQQRLVRRGSLWGTDPSESRIQEARARFPGLAEWITAANDDIPLETSEADVVLALLEGEHLPAIIQEMVRVSRANGVLALALPAEGGYDLLHLAARATFVENPAWHKQDWSQKKYWPLQEIITLSHQLGAIPFWGATMYEPIRYSSPRLFLEDTGQEKQRWTKHFKEDFQEEAWQEITDRWIDSLPPGDGEYIHEGQSSYTLLRATA